MQSASPTDPAAELEKLKRRLVRERAARLEAEAIAERGLRDLYEQQRRLQLVEAVAVAANRTASVKDAFQFAVGKICEFTGWPLGHVYLVKQSHSGDSLLSSNIWHPADTGSFAEFRKLTEEITFEPGRGLPGRVLQSSAPHWIESLETDANFPRMESARKASLKSAFAFPVLVDTEVAAVMEFFAIQLSEPDETLLRLMNQVGTQLGRVVERKRSEDALIYDASHDSLTQLPNRALFKDRLERALARRQRHPGFEFAVLFVDLDRFKVVNDSLGHNAGDRLLVEVSRRLADAVRDADLVSRSDPQTGTSDTLARLGGDEFTVLIEDIHDETDAIRVGERILEVLKEPFSVDGNSVVCSASIGVATSRTGYASVDAILRDADLAMYRAKAHGKARCELFDTSMHEQAVTRLRTENALRRALEDNEFVLHYQPVVALDSGGITGFEALVRWQRRDGKMVPPNEFIGIAEDTGLIVPIGLWVFDEACRAARQWQQDFPQADPLTMSINVSARQFAQSDLVKQVADVLTRTSVDPRTIRLEITESMTVGDINRIIRVLTELRETGMQLSVDDFGTGYSSLSYLHRLPLDILKIDRSFIQPIEQDEESLQIVRSILALAKNLSMDVVAEGTETVEQVRILRSMGCAYAQGYYFSRPVPRPEIARILRDSAALGMLAASG